MAFVYKHIRLDTNEIFYIGIGKRKSRLYSKESRNPYWKNITNNTTFKAEIIKDDLSWEEACQLEIDLIKKYKRKKEGGLLCNITLGGDGACGFNHTDEHKKYLSEKMKGGKLSEETKQKISNSHKGRKFTVEHKLKLSISKKGKAPRKGKKVLNIETNEIYSCLAEACRILNLKYSTVLYNIKNMRKINNTNLIYINDEIESINI